ncbi:MAG: carbohydrate ABC transporter permease [Tyzzerella sp.]|nr:carbohydrate ABC transporter permease [Tyzzerella sp.]MBQ4559794.1 carbohydrate ABC transporter permease [Tyzzerella sp.]
MRFRRKRDLLDKRRTIWEKMFFILLFLVLFVWAAIVVYMLLWAFMCSLKTNLEYVNEPLTLPVQLHFENFKIALDKLSVNNIGFLGMLWHSLWQSVGPALISTTMALLVGYVFAQYQFPGKAFLFGVIVFTMLIPLYGSMAASYRLMFDLKLANSYLYLIKCVGGFGGGMLVPYGYFKAMPKEMREAVYVDGGSDDIAFWKVYFPLSRNIFIPLAMLTFIAEWNDFQNTLLYFDKMPNLALGLYYFQQEIQYVVNNPAYFAGTLIVMAPVVILFIFASDKIMGQLYSGGLKG